MFEARLNQGSLLKKIFEAVKELASEVNIEVSEEGIELQAMDSCQVSLVKLDMKVDCFEHYRCDKSRPLGLNMATVVKVMKMCNNDDQVTLRHHDGADHLIFCFENELERKMSEFKLKLTTFEDEKMGVPDIHFKVHATISTRLYSSTVATLIQFSEVITINATKDGNIAFIANGDAGDAKTLFTSTEGDAEVNVQASEDTTASFGARNLSLFSKAAPLSNSMKLLLSNDQPLLVVFTLNDEPSMGTMTFFLAPKSGDEVPSER